MEKGVAESGFGVSVCGYGDLKDEQSGRRKVEDRGRPESGGRRRLSSASLNSKRENEKKSR